MATGAEQPSGERLDPDALRLQQEDGFLDHFLEEDARPQDVNLRLRLMANLGVDRKIRILSCIFAKCDKDENDCIVWRGPDSGNGRGGGYGRFSFQGITSSVHRTVYAICYGPIPGKKQIDHTCNNRRCCNPKHLVQVTHKKNQKLRDSRKIK